MFSRDVARSPAVALFGLTEATSNSGGCALSNFTINTTAQIEDLFRLVNRGRFDPVSCMQQVNPALL